MTMLIQPPPRIDFCDITTDETGRLRAKIARPWSLYLDALFVRVGGNVADSPDELAQNTAANALGIFGRQVPPSAEPADVRYVGSFLPRVTPWQEPADPLYVGTFLPRSRTNAPVAGAASQAFNQSTSEQGPGFAADTYLTGSSINTFGLLKDGTRYRLVFHVAKTNAGVAAPTVIVRFGTAGAIGDAAILTFTLLAQTAAVDNGRFELDLTFRNPGAACIAAGVIQVAHALATTGLQTRNSHVVQVTSAAFDTTVANSFIGVSLDGGASAAWTVQLVQASLENTAT